MNQSTAKVQDFERGERLREERLRLGLSQTDLAQKANVSKGSQILYEKGNAPTADYLAAIGEAGANIFYILTGDMVQNIAPSGGTDLQIQTHGDSTQSQYMGEGLVRLPAYDVRASAGLGLPVGDEVQLGAVAFDRQFLRDHGARPEMCSIITASGDSMQPAIPDGSMLVVDHSQTEVKNGYIMVINIGDDLLVKRIRRRLDGTIELISDNPLYPPETVGPTALQNLRIVGRVIYFCRTP